jgi:hypothetical protein
VIADRLVLDSTVLIPLPEAERFVVRRERKEAGQASPRTEKTGITIEEYVARLSPAARQLFEPLRDFLANRPDTAAQAWQKGVSYRRGSDRTWVTWIEATSSEVRMAIPAEAENERLEGVRMFGDWPVVAIRDMDDVHEVVRLLTPDYEPRQRTMGSAETIRDYYVSIGEGPHRTWEDCVRYGYISAGGGSWYSRSLQQLKVGTRIFAYIPKTGYVGVGVVSEPAVPVTDFRVHVGEREVPILEAPLAAPALEEYARDPEKMEYAVRVDWIRTLEKQDAISERGLFANQNSACRLTDRKTLETLIDRFGLSE